MDNELCKKIVLKNISSLKQGKYIIYGTKDIALLYYEELIEKYGFQCIECFIDGRKNNNIFKNKNVYTCEELKRKKIDLNNYIYILGTVSKIPLFKQNLKDIGIYDENIFENVHYFSADYLSETVCNVKNIYLFPEVKKKEELNKLINLLSNYLTITDKTKNKIYIESNIQIDIQLPNGFEVSQNNFRDITNEDIILVWKAESLIENILENKDRVFCIDNNFIYNLGTRILYMISLKFSPEKSEQYYKKLSKSNYKKLLKSCKDNYYTVVCGGGPSLNTSFINMKELLNKSNVIVCNDFYIMGEQMDFNPQIYVIRDDAWLTLDFSDRLQRLMTYIYQHNCFLVVNFNLISVYCNRFPWLEERIIGLKKNERENVFTNIEQLEYSESANVVTSLCVSIASGLTETIYFIGCDGSDKSIAGWDYAYDKPDDMDLCEGTFLNPVIKMDENYPNLVNEYYKNILNFGESKGKKYYTLSHSHFQELEKRFLEYSSLNLN